MYGNFGTVCRHDDFVPCRSNVAGTVYREVVAVDGTVVQGVPVFVPSAKNKHLHLYFLTFRRICLNLYNTVSHCCHGIGERQQQTTHEQ